SAADKIPTVVSAVSIAHLETCGEFSGKSGVSDAALLAHTPGPFGTRVEVVPELWLSSEPDYSDRFSAGSKSFSDPFRMHDVLRGLFHLSRDREFSPAEAYGDARRNYRRTGGRARLSVADCRHCNARIRSRSAAL